jgi:hypothetical protein
MSGNGLEIPNLGQNRTEGQFFKNQLRNARERQLREIQGVSMKLREMWGWFDDRYTQEMKYFCMRLDSMCADIKSELDKEGARASGSQSE